MKVRCKDWDTCNAVCSCKEIHELGEDSCDPKALKCKKCVAVESEPLSLEERVENLEKFFTHCAITDMPCAYSTGSGCKLPSGYPCPFNSDSKKLFSGRLIDELQEKIKEHQDLMSNIRSDMDNFKIGIESIITWLKPMHAIRTEAVIRRLEELLG